MPQPTGDQSPDPVLPSELLESLLDPALAPAAAARILQAFRECRSSERPEVAESLRHFVEAHPDVERAAVVSLLISFLEEAEGERSSIARPISWTFDQLGPDCAPYLVEALRRKPGPELRLFLLKNLGCLDRRERASLPFLEEALGDPDPWIRLAAASSIEDLIGPTVGSRRTFLEALVRDDAEIRVEAASEMDLRDLPEAETERALSVLTEALGQSVVRNRVYLALDVSRFGLLSVKAVPALIRRFQDPRMSEDERTFCVFALMEIGTAVRDWEGTAVPEIIAALEAARDDPDPLVRDWAASAIKTIRKEK
jgi:HEAT repeat protein